MSRILVIVLALTMALTVGAFPAGAQPRVGAPPAGPQDLEQVAPFADFNNDGLTDLAVGAPQENVGATANAGAVNVFYGIAAGTGLPAASQTLVQVNVEAGDQFGAALTVGSFNNDPFDDLAVGAPGEDFGATADVGSVNVFFGGGMGLNPAQALQQNNPELGDQFGAALTAGDFANDPFDDLVVAAPGENVGAIVDAGAANLFANPAGVLPAVSGPALLQNNIEAGDQFGAALTVGLITADGFADLVVGAPGEDVGAIADAGVANVFANLGGALPVINSQTLAQNNIEAGDQFGAALTAGQITAAFFFDLVVGAPGEDVGAIVDAGVANLFANLGGALPVINSQTLAQANIEAGDQFGAALTAKFLNGPGSADLVVGAPGEDVGAIVDAGVANVFANLGGALPVINSQTLAQANIEAGDQFGAALDI